MSKSKIIELIEPLIHEKNCQLVDLELFGAGKNQLLKIFIEGEKNTPLELCAELNREIATLLRVENPSFQDSCTLEVSSPGLFRSLKKIEDYQRFKGEQIKIKTFRSINNKKHFSGKLLHIDGDTITVIEQDIGEIKFSLTDIARANLNPEITIDKWRNDAAR